MAILKCKMCGGELNIQDGMTVAECEYCGSKQTLPKLVSDNIANLYDRANHFRRNNDFDKAEGIYERILAETPEDAEAYWSLVLCRYGIEYVEDPTSGKRVPTVNRAQYTSIFDDENYKSAIKHADAVQHRVYEEEAAAINEIQKGILAISQKEKPFDVFICYKETDQNGRRTRDSVIATDLYHQLTKEGFKVFFSRITLEDKLGTAYEPYIFAALNSAKVMVVLGTKPEYFNAVWVKNEWSRYLALVKQGGDEKVLIPAYRDMDPYDLPEEFSHLQAQDMSKLGFMQDLVRGIKKLTGADQPKPQAQTVTVNTVGTGATDIAPLLKRMFIYLEDGEWDKAIEYSERVLDKDPENGEAYLGKLMASLKVRRKDDLKDQAQPFDGNKHYQKAVRFGDVRLKAELKNDIDYINNRNAEEERRQEEARKEQAYNEAVGIMNSASTEEDYKKASDKFYSVSGYKDANDLAKKCSDNAETCRKDSVLDKAKGEMEKDTLEGYYAAKTNLSSISGWKDADKQLAVCEKRIKEISDRKADSAKKKKKRITTFGLIAATIIAIVITFVICLNTIIIPNQKYDAAVELFKGEKYDEAIIAFTALDGYKDSTAYIRRANTGLNNAKQYAEAVSLMDTGTDTSIEQAKAKFEELSDYKDSKHLAKKCNDKLIENASKSYKTALGYMEKTKYQEAYEQFGKYPDYSDSSDKMQECLKKLFSEAVSLYNGKDYRKAFSIFQYCEEKSYSANKSTEYMGKCNDSYKSMIQAGEWLNVDTTYPIISSEKSITVNSIRYRYNNNTIEFSVDYSIKKNEFTDAFYDFDAETSPYFTTFTEEKLDIDGKSFTFSVDYEKLMRGFRNGDYTKVCLGVDYLWESNEKMAYYDSITEYFSQGDLEKIDLYGKAF